MLAFVFLILVCGLGCGGDQDRADTGRSSGSADPATVEGADTEGSDGTFGARPEPAKEVLVTDDEPSLPEGCRPREVGRLVLDFFDAFNSGDREALSRLFFVSEGPSPPDFSPEGYYPWSWYLVSEVGSGGEIKGGFVSYDQDEMLDYFAKRHGHGERLDLLKVGVTGGGLLGEEGNVGITYVLTREADDLEPRLGGPDHVAFGRGGVNCKRRQIFAWSMEMSTQENRRAREASRWLCGEPPGWRPDESAVACA
jgi:hypothetical protein